MPDGGADNNKKPETTVGQTPIGAQMMTFLRIPLAAAAVAATLAAAPASAQEPLTLAVTGQGTTIYSMGAPLAKLLEDNGIPTRLQPMGGATAYAPLLGTGEVDFGIINISVLEAVYAGNKPFPRANTDVRLATVLYPFMVGLLVRDDSDIKSIPDVKGKTLPGGFNQMPYINPIIRALLANGGLTTDDVEQVPVATINAGLDDFDAGRIEVGYFGVGGGRVLQSDAAVGGVRFVPLVDTPEAVAGMNKNVAGAFVRTLAAGSFPGIPVETPVMAYDMVLAVGADVPDETVEKVLKVIADNKATLAEGFGGYRGFEKDAMAKPQYGVPYHDGAIGFYKSEGLWK